MTQKFPWPILWTATALLALSTTCSAEDTSQSEYYLQDNPFLVRPAEKTESELTLPGEPAEPKEANAAEDKTQPAPDTTATQPTATDTSKAQRRKHRMIENASTGKKAKKVDPALAVHQYLKPSENFVKFFSPYAVRVGWVTFLRDTVSDLVKRQAGCRVVPAETKNFKDIVSCSDPKAFGADGEEVIFEYLPSNDVLCGVEYFFADDYKAQGFAKLIVREIQQKSPTYDVVSGNETDSPLFRVTVQKGVGGSLVKVSLNLRDEVNDYETFGREEVRNLDFGELSIGRSQASSIQIQRGNEEDECVRTSASHLTTAEYYGKCFKFPYDAHFQVVRDPVTDIVTGMALTPLSVLTSGLVDNALVKKYGEPEFCERIESDFMLVRTNHQRKYHSIPRTDRVKNKSGTVYVGTCKSPIVFTVGDRYLFVVDKLTTGAISKDYARRRDDNELIRENRRELEKRRNQLSDFF